MHFVHLRLTGFKSFVDPTELLVEPGLTGIVGPNGCGKSNLVEALRWVMGESSPKRMRSGGMDDVIFAGTQSRPARNIAEVSLLLDNADRVATAAFNDSGEIEVTRRIERESGSAYRINGADVRARDVQTLFADMVTGAHSSALVSQGEIGALIQAKPEDRRALLEEAAGITGLHARRHEAELRLRAAETNLERLADVAVALESQHRALKRQVRQASRYGKLSHHIRTAEALLLLRLWNDAVAEAESAAAALRSFEREAGEAARLAAASPITQAEAAGKVPPFRELEAECAARLQRLNMELENLAAEETRARDDMERIRGRILHSDSDTTLAETQGTDATAKISEIERERERLEAGRRDEADERRGASKALAGTTEALAEATATADGTTERFTLAEARRAALAAELDAAARRLTELSERAAEIAAEQTRLGSGAAIPERAEGAIPAIADARAAAQAAAASLEAAEAQRANATSTLSSCREAADEAEAAHRKVAAEVSALSDVLTVGQEAGWLPIMASVTVEPGYAAALAAALGDDLQAPDDSDAPSHWRTVEHGDMPPLPGGAEPLGTHIEAPPALRLSLSQIGVVDAARGEALRADLAPGQRLVSREGALWRWDGFTAAADSGARAAVPLRQRNRHKELTGEAGERKRTADHVRAALERSRHEAAAAEVAEADARAAARAAEEDLRAAREAHAGEVEKQVARNERVAGLAASAAETAAEIQSAQTRRAEANRGLAALPEAADLRGETVAARERLDATRAAHSEADRTHARLSDLAGARAARLQALEAEAESWRQRAAAAETQLERLARRRAADEADLGDLEAKPADIASRRAGLHDRTVKAETARSLAADALATAEGELAAADKEAKSTARAEADAREVRVRAEAQAQASTERLGELERRMAADLECAPEDARAVAGLGPDDPLPDADAVEERLDRLKRERENMGAVNLRAKTEAEELQQQLSTMAAEREDLEGAIRKLRGGIGNLNREGRQRMLAAFDEVNGQFRRLFSRLFGGGDAHLKLVDSDDPLEAGLEIMASPPGKRLQILSLLSGGEQALTAIALRFAVFLTNPAPICVMDEVDAPLDDANVARYCDLVEEFARRTNTRFLVITHHPLTMARMDRLFGVTMAERGVSQLVSVDLARAEALREAS